MISKPIKIMLIKIKSIYLFCFPIYSNKFIDVDTPNLSNYTCENICKCINSKYIAKIDYERKTRIVFKAKIKGWFQEPNILLNKEVFN